MRGRTGKIRRSSRPRIFARESLFLREGAFFFWSRRKKEQMSYVLGLKCKECGHRVPVSAVHVCEQCFGPYEVEYDYAQMKGKVTRESIARGPKSLWRYRDLLPIAGHPQAGLYS